MAKIAFADLRRAVKWGALGSDPETGSPVNGVELVQSKLLDASTAAAISEVKQTASGALSIKLHDKHAALVSIGKELGMFIERHEHGGPGDFERMSRRRVAPVGDAGARAGCAGGREAELINESNVCPSSLSWHPILNNNRPRVPSAITQPDLTSSDGGQPFEAVVRNKSAIKAALKPKFRPIKNEKSQFVKGYSGNPKGRPKGSRNKIGEAFLDYMYADWLEHGGETIKQGCVNSTQKYI